MAIDVKNIAIGGAVLSIGDWVTAAGAGSLTDVGLLKDGSELTFETENYEVESDSAQGMLAAVPIKTSVKIKAVLQEATLDNLRRVLNQVTGNLSGTAPNKTLLVGERSEQYHQLSIVSKGPKGSGLTSATRTITGWKGVVKIADAIAFKKGAEQTYGVEITLLYDPSVSTADKFLKIVDTGGA